MKLITLLLLASMALGADPSTQDLRKLLGKPQSELVEFMKDNGIPIPTDVDTGKYADNWQCYNGRRSFMVAVANGKLAGVYLRWVDYDKDKKHIERKYDGKSDLPLIGHEGINDAITKLGKNESKNTNETQLMYYNAFPGFRYMPVFIDGKLTSQCIEDVSLKNE